MNGRFDKFTLLIDGIYKSVQKIKTGEMSEMGLKSTHIAIFLYLSDNPYGLTLKELQKSCFIDKAAVSRGISELEKNGFVYAESSFEKKYNLKVTLTGKGVKAAEEIKRRADKVFDFAVNELNLTEREKFYETLESISLTLQKISEKYGEKNGSKNNY